MSNLAAQIEVWKKIVDVQQHFNDLELRIRNFALIVTGAFIGLGGYALKDGGFVHLWGCRMSVSGLVVACSILPLFAFYLMDRLWYHRLLDGAVQAATPVEGRLRDMGIIVDLGPTISRASPFHIFGRKIRSKHKMDGFYGILIIAVFALSGVLAFGVKPALNQRTSEAQLQGEVAPPAQNIHSKPTQAPIPTAKLRPHTDTNSKAIVPRGTAASPKI